MKMNKVTITLEEMSDGRIQVTTDCNGVSAESPAYHLSQAIAEFLTDVMTEVKESEGDEDASSS